MERRRPTIRTVATAAGVSTATVSYVLSGRAGTDRGASVSEATVAKVRAAAAQLGYRPNQSARATRTGRTGLALLSLTMLSDPWSLAVVDAVRRRLAPAGLTPLILADSDWTEAAARQIADVVFVDGLAGPEMVDAVRRLADRGTRLVVFSETLEPDGFDVVRSVARPGCDMLLDHLFGLTHDVACLSSAPIAAATPGGRVHAWADASRRHAGTVDESRLQLFDGSQAGAYEASLELLGRTDRPRAVYAVSDYAAISAVHAALRLGLEPGRDVLIAGVGNTVDGERLRPSLTTTGPLDFFERLAGILLAAAHADGPLPGTLHDFPWQLFARETTGETHH